MKSPLAKNRIGVIVYSPMQEGLLTGKFTKGRVIALPEDDMRKNNKFFQEPQLSLIMDFVDKLRTIGTEIKQPVANIALAWTLRRPEITGAIAGARHPNQIEETYHTTDLKLAPGEWAKVDALLASFEKKFAEL